MFARRGPGLVGTMARTAVIAGTAGRVAHRQQQRYSAEANQQQAAAAPPAAAAAPVEDPTLVQLQQLAALRDQGILTEDEFTAKKAQLLGI